MQFFSTRDHNRVVSASQAIAQGLSDEGGLFVPQSFPQVDVKAICALDYPEMAAAIVGQYLTDYSQEFLQEAARPPMVRPLAERRAIWPLFRMRCTLWNCGTARPAPSRITPCS